MTRPLNFHRCEAPVQSILPPLTDNERIRAFLVAQGEYSPLHIRQFLHGYEIVKLAKQQLGIKE